MQKQGLLRRHILVRTDDPDRLRHALFGAFQIARFDVVAQTGRFFGQLSRVRLNEIGIDYAACSAEIAFDTPAAEVLSQHVCLSGSGVKQVGDRSAPLSPIDTCVIGTGAPAASRYGGGFRQLILRVDPGALQRKFEALTGAPAKTALAFPLAADFRSPPLRNFRRLLFFIAGELDSEDAAAPSLAMMEMEQALMVAFLCGHRHNLAHLLDARSASAAPWQVRLVEAYLEANWDKPFTMEAVAEASGVSLRSIFQSFREYRDCTPGSFVRDLRLDRARAMLSGADAEISVTQAALSCGFQSHGHFAREYKRRFGELPSATLGRARVAPR